MRYRIFCLALAVTLISSLNALAAETTAHEASPNQATTIQSPAEKTDVKAETPVLTETTKSVTTTTQTTPTLNGQVQVTESTTATETTVTTPAPQVAADYLDIAFKPLESKYKMQQFELTLQNKQPKHIELLQVEVVNGLSEQTYAQIQQEKAASKRRLAGGVLRGLTSVATSFVPYAGLGSVAAYQGIYAGSQAAMATASAIENTGGDAGSYTGRITQRASNVFISPKQSFQCLAVVPEQQSPVVKVIFKDLQTNQIFELQH
ncbi:MAG: hypothetical protein VKJ04_06830 [Vampirovibrionales bacterium]|nr:hypothetical protein [Vampirovibrionales bacterium]